MGLGDDVVESGPEGWGEGGIGGVGGFVVGPSGAGGEGGVVGGGELFEKVSDTSLEGEIGEVHVDGGLVSGYVGGVVVEEREGVTARVGKGGEREENEVRGEEGGRGSEDEDEVVDPLGWPMGAAARGRQIRCDDG